MGEVTGWIRECKLPRPWHLSAPDWPGVTRLQSGETADCDGFWTFRRRIDAVAFARRKGIRLEEER